MPVAFVMSGGGTRGDFQAGALDYLVGQGIRPDIIVSTSVGSLNGLMLAHGPQAIFRLRDVWMGLKRNSDMYLEAPWLTHLRSRPPSCRVARGVAACPTSSKPPGSEPPPERCSVLWASCWERSPAGPSGASSRRRVATGSKKRSGWSWKRRWACTISRRYAPWSRPCLTPRRSGHGPRLEGRLRVAMVGLRSGEIAYVGEEDGSLYDYDLKRVKATIAPRPIAK
jgi:hypothetical protein